MKASIYHYRIANRGAREHHRQAALHASEKVLTQTVHEREFQSISIAIPSSRMGLAKEMIRKFRTQFSEAMNSEHCDQVYQFNLHFFRLTESPSERLSAQMENEGVEFIPAERGLT